VVVVLALPVPLRAQPAQSNVELVSQLGHSSDVLSAAFSPDSRTIVSGSSDTTVKVWDVASGRELRTLVGHGYNRLGDGKVFAVAFSPDGRTVASASGDWTVKLWEAATGRELHTLKEHREAVLAVAFSPDGRIIATGGADKTVKLWDVADGRELRTLSGHDNSVAAVAFSPGGRAIASASSDKTLKLWDVASGNEVRKLVGHASAVSAIAFSRDGREIVSGSVDSTLKVWDVQTGRELRTVRAHDDAVSAVSWSPDGKVLVSSSGESLKMWNAANGQEIRSFGRAAQSVSSLAFAPEGNGLLAAYKAFAGGGGFLKLWDATTGGELRSFMGRGSTVTNLASSPNGDILSVGNDQVLRIWDTKTGRQLHAFGRLPDVTHAAFSPDGRLLILASNDKTVRLWDAASGREVRVLKGHEQGVTSVAVSPNGRTLASGSLNGGLKLWDVATGRDLRTVYTGEKISAVAFTPDGRFVFTATSGLVRVWDLMRARWLEIYVGHGRQVTSIAFSPDGQTLVSGSADKLVKLWRTNSEAPSFRTLAGHTDNVTAVAFAPDGNMILSGSADKTLKLWDVSSGRNVRTMRAHIDRVFAVTYSLQGRTFVSAGMDKTIRHWSGDGELLATSLADGGQWMTITPEGFFDASESGAQMLTAVRGLEAFSIDQFYQVLYRPDLVREKLAGDPRGLVREAAAKLDLDKVIGTGGAPSVALVHGGSSATATAVKVRAEQGEVTATITDSGGGVGRVEWRVNGVTVGLDARGFDRLGHDAPGALQLVTQPSSSLVLTRNVDLAPGENVIEVIAYNAANLIASPPARLAMTREGATEVSRPRLHVLAVGVNTYHDSRLQLAFATVDARALGDGLKRAGGTLYESVEVTTVLDEGGTAANLENTFAALAGKIRPHDVFVFFLAGHGKTIDGRYYFLPQDFRYSGDESIVSQGIGQDKWQEWFSRISARKSLLLYDTCESGSLTGDRVATRGVERVAALERMTRATGRTTLTASTDDAPALEGYRGHGVFTYALLDAFGKADSNGDGLVDVTELASFIDTHVPELSFQAFRQRQFPQMKIVGSNFPVVAKAALLPVGDAALPPIPTKPTHVVVTSANVYAQADGAGLSTSKLAPGTLVTLVRAERGWALIARQGKQIGYVAQQQLVAAQ
jgi:WD40 repeat protein